MAGSLVTAMALATAAAANMPGRTAPPLSRASGPTRTMRSLLSSLARLVSSSGVAPLMPTTAIRSLREAEAASRLVRRACCTVSSPLSQTMIWTCSAAFSTSKAPS